MAAAAATADAGVTTDPDPTPPPPPASWEDVPVGSFADVAAGARMHYRHWGWAEGGPPSRPEGCKGVVLLCHGIVDFSYRFHFLASRIADAGYAVVAPDLLGRGRSPLPAPGTPLGGVDRHTADDYVEQLEAFLGAIGLLSDSSPKLTLIGHSMGGAVVTAFAAAHTDRLERLGLLAAAGLMDGGPLPCLRCFFCCWAGCCHGCLYSLASGNNEEAWKDDYVLRDKSPWYPWVTAHQRLMVNSGTDTTDAFIASAMKFPLHQLGDRVDTLLKTNGWKGPTLLMFGDKDKAVPFVSYGRWKARLEAAGVALTAKVYEDTAHAFFLEKAAEVNADIVEWLKATEGGSGERAAAGAGEAAPTPR